MSAGPIRVPLVTWNPRQMTRGGPSNRVQLASQSPTGMKGPWWDPRIQPATSTGMVNGSIASPIDGKPSWARTIMTGSSSPMTWPVSLFRRRVLVEAAMVPSFLNTCLMMYRDGAPTQASRL